MASGRGSSNVEKLVDLHLLKLHHEIHTCLKENGDGLQVSRLDKCKLRIKYPNGTPNTWVYRKKSSRIELREPFNLTWDYDICDMLIYWTQAKKRAAVMTKDTIDCYLSTGRQEQIVRHLLHPGECQNEQACMEDIRNVLPSVPPLMPGQAKDCALVGNAGNLKTELSFAKEIDNHSTIIRLNDAVINDKYFKWTGNRTSYRFINERVARALDYFISRQYIRNETLIFRRALGEVFVNASQGNRNEAYISIVTTNGSGGLVVDRYIGYSTGFLALNFAVSVCETVDLYGFSVDAENQPLWTRYFSNPRFGHAPLTNRAYYHLLECLGVVKLHSSIRRLKEVKLPKMDTIKKGYLAAVYLKKHNRRKKTPFSINSCHYPNMAQYNG